MTISKYRIIYMGTPAFSVSPLLTLLNHQYNIVACITQPDKKKGRGYEVSFSDVKKTALENGLPVLQPTLIRKQFWLDKIIEMKPNLLITCAYGQMLPKKLLDIPEFGCINIHASLLPEYRGASPISKAIYDGKEVTGVTTMMTNEGMDTGDILLKKQVDIPSDMTFSELHDLLSAKGSELIIETLKQLEEGAIIPIKQDDNKASYAPMVNKEDGFIDWERDAQSIHNQIRAFNPWPGSYTFYKDKKLKILSASFSNESHDYPFGMIINKSKEHVDIACSTGILLIRQLQFENKRVMDVKECYHNMETGTILGGGA
ncbi:MAG: methionyl-tRNA formyltransferase [Clostridia bacterium]|nr:methionyl-tRNA formyltransferase [Clostridia bacterium]